MTGIERAVACFDGSPTKTAVALGHGVARQNVAHWLKTGQVPEEHAPNLSHLTSVPLWDLCPKTWHRVWPHLAKTPGAPEVAEADRVPAEAALVVPAHPMRRAGDRAGAA